MIRPNEIEHINTMAEVIVEVFQETSINISSRKI